MVLYLLSRSVILGIAVTTTPDSDSVEPSSSVFTVSAPARYVHASDGTLVANLSASVFSQQDILLTSWLLSTISSSFLSSFTDVRSILEAERTAVLLTGLLSDFDVIVSSASLSSALLSFQRLVDALLECEACQMQSVSDVMVAANFVDSSSLPVMAVTSRGGRPPIRGRGWGFPYFKEASLPQYVRPNVGVVPTRRPHAPNLSTGTNPFVSPGVWSPTPRSRAIGDSAGHYSTPFIGQHSGADYSYGARTNGPVGVDPSFGLGGSVRPHLSDAQNFSGPNANCVNFSEVPRQTKS
ncbi:hypothetical protein PVK06_007845 [Gossypium arboreum]|uniref:Uncharacterized protein n=1 Tax=Gossypium arboreum TaxID=29729 RepID=A0ABR0QIE4_GOSAR|nr:hypothetical protein PVK06_007845 [Gossypium arboreum]